MLTCLGYHAQAPVAQLDRASDFGSEGWGFESLRARQIYPAERHTDHQWRESFFTPEPVNRLLSAGRLEAHS
jgi:hypothetical protein